MGVACCEVCDIYFTTHLRKNVFALAIEVRAFLFKVYEIIVQLKIIYTLKAFILLALKNK